MEIDGGRPQAKRYISPITPDERMADLLLRSSKRLQKLGISLPFSEADLAEVEAERDRLRQLRGYGTKKRAAQIATVKLRGR